VAAQTERTFPADFLADHSTPATKRPVKSRSEIRELLKKVHVGGYPGIPTVKA
jgi:hypothetical protein